LRGAGRVLPRLAQKVAPVAAGAMYGGYKGYQAGKTLDPTGGADPLYKWAGAGTGALIGGLVPSLAESVAERAGRGFSRGASEGVGGAAVNSERLAGKVAAGAGGRVGSAGDLASWQPEDLWSGYMKNRGTPLGDSIAQEIQRRGLAGATTPTTVRPVGNAPGAGGPGGTPMASAVAAPVPPSGTVGGGAGEDLTEMIRRRPTGMPASTEVQGTVTRPAAAPTTPSATQAESLAQKAEAMRKARKVGRPRTGGGG
jgi:hypothetical protein